MELFIDIDLLIVLLFRLNILFISDGIPICVQQLNRINSNLWILGIGKINTAKKINFPSNKLTINEIINYFDNNFGFDHIFSLSYKLKDFNS